MWRSGLTHIYYHRDKDCWAQVIMFRFLVTTHRKRDETNRL